MRLLAYGRAGFRVVPPWRLPYAQPDFRDLAALGAPATPVPLMLLVRQVGAEASRSLDARAALALVRHLSAVYRHSVDAPQIDAMLASARPPRPPDAPGA